MTPEVFALAAFAALTFFLTGVAVGLAWAERLAEKAERDALTLNVTLDGKVIARHVADVVATLEEEAEAARESAAAMRRRRLQ
jgi:hypothetical protein